MIDFERRARESERAADAKAREKERQAQRDVALLLEGQAPQEGGDYGFWRPYMTRLLSAFEREQEQGVQGELMAMLHEPDSYARRLLGALLTPDGQYWVQFLEQVWAYKQEQERKAAAERRMQERLARSTGDSMADEILAMLREGDLARTDIYRRYSRNVSAERINDALFVLERLGWARWKAISTGGRKREVWFVPSDEDEQH